MPMPFPKITKRLTRPCDIYNTTFKSRLLHWRTAQVYTFVILSTRQFRMLRITILTIVFDFKHALQLLARNHILLSRTGRFAQWIRRLVPAVGNTGDLNDMLAKMVI
jgi:hypothetical protein